MNYKFTNKYYLHIPKDFILEYNINWDFLFNSIEKYINHNYLQNKTKTFKVKLDNNDFNNVIFHKIELVDNNKSSKKWKRVLIFILLNKPNWINTIFPIFSFDTQEEKKYTTKLLHTKEFVYKLFRKFNKYKWWIDYKWKKLSDNLGVEIKIK